MTKHLFGLGLCLALLATAGCMKHSYTVGSGAPPGSPPVYSRWHNHFIFGIIGEDNVDVTAVCPSGNATVKEGISFINGLIGLLIGIIYYPTTVVVYCAGGAAPPPEVPPSAP